MKRIPLNDVQLFIVITALRSEGYARTADYIRAQSELADPANDGPEVAILQSRRLEGWDA